MPVVDARDLSKSYGPDMVLDRVSLAIDAGERVGLVGVNGSGKSTLARIICGAEPSDGGKLTHQRDARIAYLAQTPEFDPGRTALQEVLCGLSEWSRARARHETASTAIAAGAGDLEAALREQARAAADVERFGGWGAEHVAESLLDRLAVRDREAVLGHMSGGEQRRTALARILVSRPTLAVLDEPTNHLDIETIEWLEDHLMNDFNGALLLVTHDRYFLDRVVRRTLELSDGKLYGYDGGYAAYLEAKAERLAHEARTEANRQNFLRRELAWLRQGPKARTTKQKARIQRARDALRIEAPKPEREVALELETARTGKSILDLRGVGIELGGEQLVRDLDLSMTRGERIGVFGPNGCGKTTLVRTIVGELEPSSGTVVVGKNTRIAYLGQARESLELDRSIYDNVAYQRPSLIIGGREVDKRGYLGRFLFSYDRQSQPVRSLSGGERSRVALAILLSRRANLVILDEPTNDLDVSMISSLEQMLLDFESTAIIVTHDRWFLDRVATAILSAEGGGRWVRFAGSYSTYRSLKAQNRAGSAGTATVDGAGAAKKGRTRPRKRRPLTYAEEIELSGIVDRVERAEQRVAELEATLADPLTYKKERADVAALVASLDEAREAARQLMERWERLEEKRQGDLQGGASGNASIPDKEVE
jgi:ATP-binding cassette subfamily F protein uup